MDKIKIFIAEDTIESRTILVEQLKEYSEKNYNNPDFFEIKTADSYQKALNIVNNIERNSDYYDIFICDIDFTEDNKGGRNDSGFELIEKMFDVCPITFICTYSAQFRGRDLWPKYQELTNKGLIVHTMDKSHSEAGSNEWYIENFDKIVDFTLKNKFLKDIWKNHFLIKESLINHSLDDDRFEDLIKKNTILANLESILTLLRNLDKFNELPIIYRLIIYLYHNSLEIFCRGRKTDNEIIEGSNKNRKSVEGHLKKELMFDSKVSAIRTIVSYTPDMRSKFGFKLNDYRNKSIHNNQKFQIEFENILFANLTLALYVAEQKSDISLNEIEKVNNSNSKGYEDLKSIISYITKG